MISANKPQNIDAGNMNKPNVIIANTINAPTIIFLNPMKTNCLFKFTFNIIIKQFNVLCSYSTIPKIATSDLQA